MSKQSWRLPAEYAIYCILYLLVLGGAWWAGYKMEIPYHFFQYLDRYALQLDLAESLLYLHAQPPIPNLLLGLALKLETASGLPPRVSLLALQAVLGASIVMSLAYLVRALIVSSWVRGAVIVLFLINPVFYHYIFLYFYTVHELFFLGFLLACAHRYLAGGHWRDFAFVSAALVGLTYTRSLFHVAWAVLFLSFLLLFARRLQPRRVHVAGIVSLTVLLLVAWPAKNLFLFGFFGSSSWSGYNLAQQIPSAIPPITTIFVSSDVPRRFASIPVLAEPQKSGGAPNWNYYPIIAYAKQRQNEAVSTIRRQPELLLQKALRNYRQGYALYGLRHPYDGTYFPKSVDTPAKLFWTRLYERIVFQYHGENARTHYENGFTFLFPILLVASIWKLSRSTAALAERGAVTLILLTILWVLLMVLLVDGAEGNRIRFPTEPFLLVLAGWLFTPRGPAASSELASTLAT